jgi:hypothetical protein
MLTAEEARNALKIKEALMPGKQTVDTAFLSHLKKGKDAANVRADQAEGHVARLLEALDYIETVLAVPGPVEGISKEFIRRRIMKARREVMGDGEE